jgi:hypothetical protein
VCLLLVFLTYVYHKTQCWECKANHLISDYIHNQQINKPTNFMKYSQDDRLVGQRGPWIYGTKEPITTLTRSSSIAHILSHMNPIQTLISYLTICTPWTILTRNYSSQQVHIKLLKIRHTIYSYMFQHQGAIFRESKVQRFAHNSLGIIIIRC